MKRVPLDTKDYFLVFARKKPKTKFPSKSCFNKEAIKNSWIIILLICSRFPKILNDKTLGIISLETSFTSHD